MIARCVLWAGIGLASAGCHRPRPERAPPADTEAPAPVAPDPDASAERRGVEVPSGAAWQQGRLALRRIPDGWTARAWSGQMGPALRLTRPDGVAVEVRYEAGSPLPPDRLACVHAWGNASGHHDVDFLDPAGTWTCGTADGTTVQGWYGQRSGHDLLVQITLPPGTLMYGREDADVILRALEWVPQRSDASATP